MSNLLAKMVGTFKKMTEKVSIKNDIFFFIQGIGLKNRLRCTDIYLYSYSTTLCIQYIFVYELHAIQYYNILYSICIKYIL